MILIPRLINLQDLKIHYNLKNKKYKKTIIKNCFLTVKDFNIYKKEISKTLNKANKASQAICKIYKIIN